MTQYATPHSLRRTLILAATLPLVLLLPSVTPLAFAEDPIPVTGDPAPGLEPFDQLAVAQDVERRMDMIDRPVEAHEELAAAPADYRMRRRSLFHDAEILGPGRRQCVQHAHG